MTKAGNRKHKKWTRNDKHIYFMAICGVVFLAVFAYLPMVGILLAFKEGDRAIDIYQVLLTGDWCGFDNFRNLLTERKLLDILINTLCLNFLLLIFNFPAPIIFALLINEVTHLRFKKSIQTVSMFPHFISWTIFGAIIIALTDVTTGIFNPILEFLGLSSQENPVNLGEAQYFWVEMIVASIIKGIGWGSIVYMAAIAGISPELYEAAQIDGANRLQRAVKITIPMIAPTITVFLLLQISKLLGNSYEQFYSMQNAINLERSEVLATYIYRKGFTQRRYSYAAALGFCESIISVLLLLFSNFLSKKFTGRGVF